uniref:Uncharacterized protein n=1 Tax=Tanacetum cinerariifolium TaxID=118510 RepID=A0A699L0Q1_TANCI|nr:hypothetical protein [Tanacetum cinerariifolium]
MDQQRRPFNMKALPRMNEVPACLWRRSIVPGKGNYIKLPSIMDTTKVTLETKNVPILGDPSGHPPDLGSLDINPDVLRLPYSMIKQPVSLPSKCWFRVVHNDTPHLVSEDNTAPSWFETRYDVVTLANKDLHACVEKLQDEKDVIQLRCNELRVIVLARNDDVEAYKRQINRLFKDKDELRTRVGDLDMEVARLHRGDQYHHD